jgi:putative membrane protein
LFACNHAGNQSIKNEHIAAANNNIMASANSGAGQAASIQAPDSVASPFMTRAAEGGLREVALGKLAEQKAHLQRIKDFAQMIVYDHSHANGGLRSVAAGADITLPVSVGAAGSGERDRLSAMKGFAFDRAYMQMMVADHEKDIAEYRAAASKTKSGPLSQWIRASIPMLEKHLDSARAIEGYLKSHPRLKNFTQTAPTQSQGGKKR